MLVDTANKRKSTQPHNHTTRPFIENRARPNGNTGYLRYSRGGKAVYLGKLPDSPTALLEVVLNASQRLDLYSLRYLLAANKSMR